MNGSSKLRSVGKKEKLRYNKKLYFRVKIVWKMAIVKLLENSVHLTVMSRGHV